MNKINALCLEMINYYKGDARRIQHFIKVHSLARLIGKCEVLDENELFILEAAALTHDIGIKPAEEKHGSCTGDLQEKEGAAPAREMLTKLGFDEAVISRVCALIARHHTYTDIDGADCQILIEADFLVNLYEDSVSENAVKAALKNIFRTKTGIRLCKEMFNA